MRKLWCVIVFLLWSTFALASDNSLGEQDMTHRMMMLVLQLGLILFAARIGNLLLERVGLPGVLGELAAGVVIGPYLLGTLPLPGFPHGVIPLHETFPVSPELYGISSLAAIVLLFMVGLQTDLKKFLKYSIAGSLVGIGGVGASFLLGTMTAVLSSTFLFGHSVGPLAPPCLFLGIMSTATSVGITARILSEKRKLDTPEGVTILAGAVIDDVLGIVMLAVGLGILAATAAAGRVDWTGIGIIAGKAVGIWLSATIIGLLVSNKLGSLLKLFGSHASIAIMALGMALILAGLFEEAGLAMIIGAYVMGLSLSRTDLKHVISENLEPVFELLVPVFFAVMGMMVNLRLVTSANVVLFGLLYTTVAIGAKIFGCGLPALFSGFNLRGAIRIGFGMMPRGEVALIMAGIGLSAGILSPEVFGVAVMMTLITTLLAPPVLVRLFDNPATGLKHPKTEDGPSGLTFTFPSSRAADLIVTDLFKTFALEGFFVQVLNHREHIYHAGKDQVSIGFRQKSNVIEFDCQKSQEAFVYASMNEVLADLEQTLRELRTPRESNSILKKLQESTQEISQPFDIGDFLTEDVLEPRLKGISKQQIIEELLGLLTRKGLVKDVDAARKAIWEREKTMATGMQFGIAMPHGRTGAVERLVCAVGIKPDGVDFDSIDGEPSRIFVLTLAPLETMAPQLQFITAVSEALNREGRTRLLHCRTASQMFAVLSSVVDKHLDRDR